MLPSALRDPSRVQRRFERPATACRRCNLHTCPRNSYSRRAVPRIAIASAEDRSATRGPARRRWGNPCLGVVGPSAKPTAISRMPRTKRSARRRSRAARRAAARARWAIRASSRAAQPRHYRTDTLSRNARRSRRMGLRQRRASVPYDEVPIADRWTSAAARNRRRGGAREAAAVSRSQSLRSPRSRASVLRTRGRRRT